MRRESERYMIMNRKGFTLVELLTVMAVIAILAGLVLSTAGYVQKKAAMSKAQSEIAALSAACESYKADNGVYPRGPTTSGSNTIPLNATDSLDPRKSGKPATAAYMNASLYLYGELSGDRNLDRKIDTGAKTYFEFNPAILTPVGGTGTVTAIVDPFGNSYGYSTAYQADMEKDPSKPPARGFNPTFDLWSTSGNATDPPATPPDTVTVKWIKNW